MKRRDVILDFTSLLDVTLIVIFFFVIFSNLDSQANKARTDAKVQELESAVQQAENREANAKELEEQLQQEIDTVKESNRRWGLNTSEILAFENSKNAKVILDIEPGSWSARIICNEKLMETVHKGDSFNEKLKQALTEAGYTNNDTIFCDFVFDGAESGSYSAYSMIDEGLKAAQSDYKYLYVSETDLSVGE